MRAKEKVVERRKVATIIKGAEVAMIIKEAVEIAMITKVAEVVVATTDVGGTKEEVEEEMIYEASCFLASIARTVI